MLSTNSRSFEKFQEVQRLPEVSGRFQKNAEIANLKKSFSKVVETSTFEKMLPKILELVFGTLRLPEFAGKLNDDICVLVIVLQMVYVLILQRSKSSEHVFIGGE